MKTASPFPHVRPFAPQAIRQACLEHFQVEPADWMSRLPRAHYGRRVAAWIMRDRNDWSFPDIARAIGWRSHNSAMVACRAVAADPDLMASARRIVEKLELQQEAQK